ncbi:hypothetical protein P0R31_35170 [Bradyrhizobium yuanmingense]|uniref:hypothetical protein n=1 Tax=Bradyrhizobium yuanmingense TaxID=108015 RepID=UPI0023B97236|nr:hypothetical protein [Bradyrhizobium yuanmingense]MDF0522483.1 hypothetical protein [Bradyrhizobium yuanmingense]
MSESTKKPTFHDKAIPSSLEDLPRFGITPKSTSSREDSERPDIAYGVRSLRDLYNEFTRGFTDPDRSKPAPRGPSKSRR